MKTLTGNIYDARCTVSLEGDTPFSAIGSVEVAEEVAFGESPALQLPTAVENGGSLSLSVVLGSTPTDFMRTVAYAWITLRVGKEGTSTPEHWITLYGCRRVSESLASVKVASGGWILQYSATFSFVSAGDPGLQSNHDRDWYITR